MDWMTDKNLIFHILEWAVMGFIAVYSWLMRREKATNVRLDKVKLEICGKFEKIDDELQEISKSMIRTQETIRHAVTHEHLGQIYDELRKTNESLNKLTGGFNLLHRNFEIIQESLMSERNK